MYYFIEITTTEQGVAKAITDKNDLNSANMQLHQTFASAMANDDVSACLCMIINDKGAVQRYEYWERAGA